MFSDKYKKDNEKINLDNSFKDELSKKIKKGDVLVKSNNKNFKIMIGIAAAVSLVIGGYMLAQNNADIKDDGIVKLEEGKDDSVQGGDISGGNISGGNIGGTSMQSFLVYNKNNYSQVYNNIQAENIDTIKDKKIGTTVIDDSANFLSSVVGQEIYTIKGYDESVLLGVLKEGGETFITVYEYIDESNIKTGNDILSKMNIDGNIKCVTTKIGVDEISNMDTIEDVNVLLSELKTAKNMIDNKEFMDGFYSSQTKDPKVIVIELNDGILREIEIYESGHVYISGYVFELDNKEVATKIYNK